MRKVKLIGDSISIGYGPHVKNKLRDTAEVSGVEGNGRYCSWVLDHLDEWVIDSNPDIVHLNCGLHDMFLSAEGKVNSPVEEYRVLVRQLFDRILEETDSILIFATTTPVDEERQRTSVYGRLVRYEKDPPIYNAAAIEAASACGVRVNDLYGLVMRTGADRVLGNDGVHFTAEGY